MTSSLHIPQNPWIKFFTRSPGPLYQIKFPKCAVQTYYFLCLKNTFSFFTFSPTSGLLKLYYVSVNHLEILFELQMIRWFWGEAWASTILTSPTDQQHHVLSKDLANSSSVRFSSVPSSQLSLDLSLSTAVVPYSGPVRTSGRILYITRYMLQTKCWINEWTGDIGKINFLQELRKGLIKSYLT